MDTVLDILLERAYYFVSFSAFTYVIFWKGASPWFFALMVLLDLLHHAYTINLKKANRPPSIPEMFGAKK